VADCASSSADCVGGLHACQSEAAYFAIADISGYTGFLAAVELRGGRAVADALDRALPDRAGEIRRVALKPST
jgi:hypothetical protein